jgi:hypothetical protein
LKDISVACLLAATGSAFAFSGLLWLAQANIDWQFNNGTACKPHQEQ